MDVHRLWRAMQAAGPLTGARRCGGADGGPWLNISMSLLKLLVGVLSGSLAVIADAMHSATDALSSLTGLITNNLSDPQPDRDHPTAITNTKRSVPLASLDSSCSQLWRFCCAPGNGFWTDYRRSGLEARS